MTPKERAEKEITEAYNSWPYFPELMPTIVRVLKQNHYLSIRAAYELACRMEHLDPQHQKVDQADKFAEAITHRIETVGHLHK